jgi:hypothetical protein
LRRGLEAALKTTLLPFSSLAAASPQHHIHEGLIPRTTTQIGRRDYPLASAEMVGFNSSKLAIAARPLWFI